MFIRVQSSEIVKFSMAVKEKTGEYASAKDVSWFLLDNCRVDGSTYEEAKESIDGDCAASNLGLRIFEQALDWSIGIAALNLMKDFRAQTGKGCKTVIEVRKDGSIWWREMCLSEGSKPTKRSRKNA